jgi:hypothetical protein
MADAASIVVKQQAAVDEAVACLPPDPTVVTKAQAALAEAQAFAGVGTVDPRLVAMPRNTVLDLGQIPFTVPNGESLVQVRNGFVANSGMVYDGKRKRFFCRGGGHAGTNHDGPVTLSISDLSIRELYPPMSAQPDMVKSNYDFTRGAWLSGSVSGPYPRPPASHTYDQLAIWGDEFIDFNRIVGNGDHTQEEVNERAAGIVTDYQKLFVTAGQIAHLDLNALTWDWENTTPPQTDGSDTGMPQFGAVEWDPVARNFLWLNSHYLATYDPITRVKLKQLDISTVAGSKHLVNEAGTVVANTIDIAGCLNYRPVDDCFYYFTRTNTNQVWKIDVRNGYITNLVLLTTTGTPPPSTSANLEHPVRYDPGNDLFLTGPFSNKFYGFNPATKEWLSQTINGPFVPDDSPYQSHMGDFCPDAGVFVYMTDGLTATVRKGHFIAYKW